jgi:hypothetical protein
MSVKLLAAASCAAVVALGLVGCATVSESGYVLLVEQAPRTSHLAALIDGTLSLSGDCYSIEHLGQNIPVVFASGAHISEGDSVDVPGLGVIEIGDDISGGGGEVPAESSPVPLPEGCPSDTVLVFDP